MYEDWRQVDAAKKEDLWRQLNKDFVIDAVWKDNVMKEMGGQLKNWRRTLRSKYFTGLDSRGIRALKDKAPSKEKIRIPDWNAFVECEATQAKMAQKEKNKANRSLKIDVHCLGRKSYAEKNEEMVRT